MDIPATDSNQNIYIARIKNGNITEEPTPMEQRQLPIDTAKRDAPNNAPNTLPTLIPFKEENTEPIIVAKTRKGNIDVFIDSGADADVIPINLLHKHYPEWKNKRIKSKNKLRAANNTETTHQGKLAYK